MRKKAKTYISVLLTVLLSAGMISITAFAAGGTTLIPDINASSGTSSVSSTGSSSAASNDSSTYSSQVSSTPSGGNGGVDVPSQGETRVTVTLNFNGGTGGSTTVSVEAGTLVDALATPTRKGYTFAGWTSGGNAISPSLKINEDIVLTAQWTPIAASSAASSRKEPASSQKPVDTHQSEVDEAASRAEAAISEPDTLSSQDWGSLLSSSGSSETAGTIQSSQTGSSQAQKAASGISKLFLIGIILILLALIGIGFFIYLQFISGRRGPRGGGPSDSDNTMEFTDISSHSGGGHASESAPYEEFGDMDSGRPKKRTDFPGVTYQEEPDIPIEDDSQKTTRFNIPAPYTGLPKAQARPVENAKSEFDWDKFFDDDNH
jgi:uncharacterized repeat protein (TIGR02543 family)